ncbi:exopolysaccharide biosynthesis polyprenyl glycosylphosphotransferase [Methylobacterium sp. B4]|uniref:exopolysaccharide biosynthesis polyprenyl glycosylphosphotransferase n=1 Tax=Methylobacterium sp. B4 TaxID=1938755 RepID=UPI000D7536A3|nr:exopolysaccharide biosynthesis polyprenyl glycosylphosphotransferase [Methylobacterium sp. B4]PXW62156.1 exopolysaccharide biosynthesis polyprenyl glycosylphosphotransferase [Methylobacterium sp. B4]
MSEQVIGNSTGLSPRIQLRSNSFGQLGPVLVTLDAFALVGAALLAQAGAAHLAEQTADPLRLAAIAAFPTAFTLPLMALCGAYDTDAASRPLQAVKALLLIWPGLLPLAWLLTVGLQIRLDIAHDGITAFAVMGPAVLLVQRYTLAVLLRRSAEARGIPLFPVPSSDADPSGVAAFVPDRPPAATADPAAASPRPGAPARYVSSRRMPAGRKRVPPSTLTEPRPSAQAGRRRALPRLSPTERAGLEAPAARPGDGEAIKRAFDVVGAGMLCLLLAPLLLILAVLIRMTSEGPVLFRQMRGGLHGRPFEIYKFRTMTVQPRDAALVQAYRHDPRVTPLGRILRRTSLDELPQLFNVLKGDMSLVGPRPHALGHDYEFALRIADYHRRHQVKPGITGWAQVCGCRGETGTDEALRRRIELDLTYIERRSLWFDLRIILQTCREVVSSETAY